MNKVLVVSAHPDDETLGAGGTILKHRSKGDHVYWLIMTNISGEAGYAPRRLKERNREIKRVSGMYGFKGIFQLDFPTRKLDIVPKEKLIDAAGGVVKKVKPDIVYLPHRSDAHSDHRMTFEALFSAIKSFRAPFIKKVLMFEILSETNFTPPFKKIAFMPNLFSDITPFLDKKISILKVYKNQIKKHPFPRSIDSVKALAVLRGSQCGARYAESFMLLKEIW